MTNRNTYNGITQDLDLYHQYISKRRNIEINPNTIKDSLKKNKGYFYALIRFEKQARRINCSETENSYRKWLELFLDFIDGHDLSFQDRKKLTSTIGWLTKIHKQRTEHEFNEWNCSWWEFWVFKHWNFWTKKMPILILLVISVGFTILLWTYNLNDAKELFGYNTKLTNSWWIIDDQIIKPYEKTRQK